MTSVEMKPFNISSERETINILGQSLDEIDKKLKDGKVAYNFMKTQTSKAIGDKNRKAHEEDLKNMKETMDKLERVKREIQDEIKKIEKEIASKKKKGGRRKRKTRKRKSKRTRKKRRTRRAGTIEQSKEPGKRGLTVHEIKLRSKKSRDKIKKVSENIRKKLFNDQFSNLSIARSRSPSPPGFESFMKTISPPSTPSSIGGKKTRKKRRRKRRR